MMELHRRKEAMVEKAFLQKRWVRMILTFIGVFALYNGLLYGMSIFLVTPEVVVGTIFGEMSQRMLMLVAMQPVIAIFAIIMMTAINPKWQYELSTGLIPWYKGIPLVHTDEHTRFKKNIFDKTPIEWKENFIWYDKFDIVRPFRMRFYSGLMIKSRKTGIAYLVLEQDVMPLVAKAKKGFITGRFTFTQHGTYFGVKLVEEEEPNEATTQKS